MVNAKMFLKAEIDQAVVSDPSVGVNDGILPNVPFSVFAVFPVREFPLFRPAPRICHTHVLRHLRRHRSLEQPPRQLCQQPLLPDQILRLPVILQQIVNDLVFDLFFFHGHLFSIAAP
jgi:hypothetical protein